MRGIVFRLATLALALAVLASPAAALVGCLPHASGMAMKCCRTVQAQASGAPQIAGQAARGSCCEISSSRPAAPFVPNAPTTAPVHVVLVKVAVAAAPTVPVWHGAQHPVPARNGPSPQVVLCTFLI